MVDMVLLIGKTAYTTDAVGNQIAETVEREVYAEILSAKRAEFSVAAQRGLKPDLALRMFWLDYEGEAEAEYRGKRYSVYRSFVDTEEELCEVYLTEKAGVAGE